MRNHASSGVTQDHGSELDPMPMQRPAPGRRTRTERLPARSSSSSPAEAAAYEGEPVDQEQLSVWMDEAVRPDLSGGGRAGAALPGDVRGTMEHAFGADLGSVRIHESGEPAAMGAVAFARGEDIHFAPGRYDPQSDHGREILGHELTHVIQQRNGRAGVHAKGAGGDTALEAEADELGARAASGQRVEVRGAGAGTQFLKEGDKLAVRPELQTEIRDAGLLPSNRERLLAQLDALLTEAETVVAARAAAQRAIFDAIVDEEASGLEDRDRPALLEYARSLLTSWRTWSGCRSSLRSEAYRLRHRHVTGLDRESFLERLEPREGEPAVQHRARYSGSPLLDNTMEVSILVIESNPAGHAYIVFEWLDPHTPQDQLPQGERRRHELYHLEPISDWRRFQWQQPPIRISHTHGNRGNEFPQMFPTNHRSWRVPYAQGALALRRCEENKGQHDDEQYSLFGRGGSESCMSWATHIAEAAGINARSCFGYLVEVPVHENSGGEKVDTEENMWKPRDEWRALLPRMERLRPKSTAINNWCDTLRYRFNNGTSVLRLTQCVDACEQLLALSDEGAVAQCELVVTRCKSSVSRLIGSGEDSIDGAEALEHVVVIRGLLQQWGAMQPRLEKVRGLDEHGPAVCEAVVSRFRYSSVEMALETLEACELLYALRAEALSGGKDKIARGCVHNIDALLRWAITPAKAKRRLEKLRKQL